MATECHHDIFFITFKIHFQCCIQCNFVFCPYTCLKFWGGVPPKRFYEFHEKYNCFHDLQFGFRSKHSTVHALISITESIRSALDESKYVCGIFVDFQKAFDTVNHKILLDKLHHYGIRGTMNELV